MSYDIELRQGNEPVLVPSFTEGGTYPVGGTNEAKLNVTYNYAWFFYRFLDATDGIRWLYDKPARDTIARLEIAVETLGTKQYKDYWAPTPGNAGHALSLLLSWARLHPDAVWEGD